MTKTTKNLVIAAMLVALAVVGMIPQVPSPFNPALQFDLSEFFCILGGLIFGPWVGLLITFLKTAIHFLTFGGDLIGHALNVVAVGVMVVVVSSIFRPFKGTPKKWLWMVIAVVSGVIARTLVMIPVNFITTSTIWLIPDQTARMVFVFGSSVPFNLTQGVLSGMITGPLYEAYERWLNHS